MAIRIKSTFFFGVSVIKIGLWIIQSESSSDEWENDENTRKNFTKEKKLVPIIFEREIKNYFYGCDILLF